MKKWGGTFLLQLFSIPVRWMHSQSFQLAVSDFFHVTHRLLQTLVAWASHLRNLLTHHLQSSLVCLLTCYLRVTFPSKKETLLLGSEHLWPLLIWLGTTISLRTPVALFPPASFVWSQWFLLQIRYMKKQDQMRVPSARARLHCSCSCLLALPLITLLRVRLEPSFG